MRPDRLVIGCLLAVVALPVGAAEPPATPARAAAREAPAKAPAVTAAKGARPVDRLELEATRVTGSQELPRVMYVVPWKRADLGDLSGRPANSLLDEVLGPVDRDVFRREVNYFDAIDPDRPAAAPGAATQAADSATGRR